MDGIQFHNFDGTRNALYPINKCSAIGQVKITCQCSNDCGGMKFLFKRVGWFNSVCRYAYIINNVIFLILIIYKASLQVSSILWPNQTIF